MFLRLYKVNRVLFLVDRLELETQAQKEINDILQNDFETVVWKKTEMTGEEQMLLSQQYNHLQRTTNIREF